MNFLFNYNILMLISSALSLAVLSYRPFSFHMRWATKLKIWMFDEIPVHTIELP